MSLTLQTAIPLAQLGSRFLLACPLSHCKLTEYLMIPFAFPEGAQKGWNCCGYRRWAAGLVLIQSRLASVLSPEAPPNWKPWKTVWSWGDSRAGRRGHLGASRHQGGAVEEENEVLSWCQMTILCSTMETEGSHSHEVLGSDAGPHKDCGTVKPERTSFLFCYQISILQIEQLQRCL